MDKRSVQYPNHADKKRHYEKASPNRYFWVCPICKTENRYFEEFCPRCEDEVSRNLELYPI